MSKYFGLFGDVKNISGLLDFFDEMTESEKEEIKKIDYEVICAAYGSEGYDGWAFILLKKDGVLYEVNDSHCSCYGLTNWNPEETTKEALLKRSEYGVWSDEYGKELREIINQL